MRVWEYEFFFVWISVYIVCKYICKKILSIKEKNQQLFQCVTSARNGKGKSLTMSPLYTLSVPWEKLSICHYIMNECIFQAIFILIHITKSVAHCCGVPEILWYLWHWYACCCRSFGNAYQFGYGSQWCIHQPPDLDDEFHEYLPKNNTRSML